MRPGILTKYLKIDGRMVHVWRVVDAEGEVLDVLVQSKRNKHAALKLMRKLLKKFAFAPEELVTDDLRSYGAAARDLRIEHLHERGRWKSNRAAVRNGVFTSTPAVPPAQIPTVAKGLSSGPNHRVFLRVSDSRACRYRRAATAEAARRSSPRPSRWLERPVFGSTHSLRS